MTSDEIIDGILDREGEGDKSKGYLAKGDRGGRTTWGISERSHPEAWMSGPPSRARARQIYLNEYVAPWAFVEYKPLRVQLIDCHVLHGRSGAAKLLQRVLGVAEDGVIGRVTRNTLADALHDPWNDNFDSGRHVNNALVAWRLKLTDDISDADKSQKVNEEGWENRCLKFLV